MIDPGESELPEFYSTPETQRNWPIPIELKSDLWVIQFDLQFVEPIQLKRGHQTWQSEISSKLHEMCSSQLNSTPIDDLESNRKFEIKLFLSNSMNNRVSILFVTSENPVNHVFFPAYDYVFQNVSEDFQSHLELIQGQKQSVWTDNPLFSKR